MSFLKKYKIVLLPLILYLVYTLVAKPLLYPKYSFLGNHDFKQGNWLLIKGHYGDSIQYIITDPTKLISLQEKWMFHKSDRSFATTGGYNIDLYNDTDRVLFSDIINDLVNHF